MYCAILCMIYAYVNHKEIPTYYLPLLIFINNIIWLTTHMDMISKL